MSDRPARILREGLSLGIHLGGSWFMLRRPRFVRDELGWWCAPLLRIEKGTWLGDSGEDDGSMVEVPFIERSDGKLSAHLVWKG